MQFIILWFKFHLYLHSKLVFFQEIFALEVSNDYIKKALGKNWRDHKSTLKKLYLKKDISLEEKIEKCPAGNVEVPMGRCGSILEFEERRGIMFLQTFINFLVYSIYYIRNNNFIMQDRERVGTTSTQKQKFTHTAGSKSFACVADDKVF